MTFNKKIFELNFKSQNYSYCAEMLRSEIINILTEKIKLKNPQFAYKTVRDLKNNATKYLSEKDQGVCIEFYNLNFDELSSESELYTLLNLYNELILSE